MQTDSEGGQAAPDQGWEEYDFYNCLADIDATAVDIYHTDKLVQHENYIFC